MSTQSSKGGFTALKDAIRTQLWPLPTIGVVVAAVAGVLLPEFDKVINDSLPRGLTDYLFGGGAAAARSVLEAIAGSLITVTSLTFSLTVVTLQLASSQFSPRLLRTFSSDRFVQLTLALFLGTFTYALTVLRTVRTPLDDQELFVPQIAVTLAFVLTLTSVVGLGLFLAHLAKEIRVESMLENVHRDATATVERVLEPLPDQLDPTSTTIGSTPMIAGRVTPVLASATGFLVRVDERSLFDAAVEADAVVVIDLEPGGSLVSGAPVGKVWPRRGQSFENQDALDELQKEVRKAIYIGMERTAVQDVGLGLQQLTDVATKALSPGINDPTTAIHALGHLSGLLGELARHDLGPRLLRDDDDGVRVVLHRPPFEELLETAIGQPRRYGAADPMVLGRLFELLAEVYYVAPLADQRRAIVDQLSRLRRTCADGDFDEAERARFDALALRVLTAVRQEGGLD